MAGDNRIGPSSVGDGSNNVLQCVGAMRDGGIAQGVTATAAALDITALNTHKMYRFYCPEGDVAVRTGATAAPTAATFVTGGYDFIVPKGIPVDRSLKIDTKGLSLKGAATGTLYIERAE